MSPTLYLTVAVTVYYNTQRDVNLTAVGPTLTAEVCVSSRVRKNTGTVQYCTHCTLYTPGTVQHWVYRHLHHTSPARNSELFRIELQTIHRFSQSRRRPLLTFRHILDTMQNRRQNPRTYKFEHRRNYHNS